MLDKQTAYTKWLGTKVQDQPPTLYRLLGVDALESDADAISNAADSRMAFLRQFQIGDNAPLAEEVLNELSKARVTLLNAEKKTAYDARLRQRTAPQATSGVSSSALPRAEAMPATIAGFRGIAGFGPRCVDLGSPIGEPDFPRKAQEKVEPACMGCGGSGCRFGYRGSRRCQIDIRRR
jgi:hypothetical protein